MLSPLEVVAQGVLDDYKVLPLTIEILSDADVKTMQHASKYARDPMGTLQNVGAGMILERDTGFFVKLYAEAGYNNFGLSEAAQEVLEIAHKAGYLMVEFDRDL